MKTFRDVLDSNGIIVMISPGLGLYKVVDVTMYKSGHAVALIVNDRDKDALTVSFNPIELDSMCYYKSTVGRLWADPNEVIKYGYETILQNWSDRESFDLFLKLKELEKLLGNENIL